MEQSKQFRTAGFGGFHRQDVLDYIQRTTKEQSEKREELTRALTEAEAREAALRASNADLQSERDEALEKLRTLEQEHESWQLPEGESVPDLLAELEELRGQAGRYAQMKSDYAEMEIEARERANHLISAAEAEASRLTGEARAEADALLAAARSEAEGLAVRTQAECDNRLAEAAGEAERLLRGARDEARQTQEQLRERLARTNRDFYTGSADLTASVTQALREVERLRQNLADLSAVFEENARAVEELCGEDK